MGVESEEYRSEGAVVTSLFTSIVRHHCCFLFSCGGRKWDDPNATLGFRLVARREYRSMHFLLDQRYRFSAVFDGGVYGLRVNYSSVLSGTLALFSPAERHADESYLLSSSM